MRLRKGNKDEIEWEGENWETEIDKYAGNYLRAPLPLTETMSLYGLVGKTKLKYNESFSVPGLYSGGYSESEKDTSLGLGFEYIIRDTKEPIIISAELIRYYDKEEISLTGFSLSALFEF